MGYPILRLQLFSGSIISDRKKVGEHIVQRPLQLRGALAPLNI
jgi:hypothetical protein